MGETETDEISPFLLLLQDSHLLWGTGTLHNAHGEKEKRELGNQNGYLAAKTLADFDSKLIVLDAGCSWSKWLRELISGMGAPLTGDGRGHEGGKGSGRDFPIKSFMKSMLQNFFFLSLTVFFQAML